MAKNVEFFLPPPPLLMRCELKILAQTYFYGISESPQANCMIVPHSSPWLLSSMLFQIILSPSAIILWWCNRTPKILPNNIWNVLEMSAREPCSQSVPRGNQIHKPVKCPILKLKTLIIVWPAAFCKPGRNEWVEVSLYQPVCLYLPCKFKFLEFHQNLGRKTSSNAWGVCLHFYTEYIVWFQESVSFCLETVFVIVNNNIMEGGYVLHVFLLQHFSWHTSRYVHVSSVSTTAV